MFGKSFASKSSASLKWDKYIVFVYMYIKDIDIMVIGRINFISTGYQWINYKLLDITRNYFFNLTDMQTLWETLCAAVNRLIFILNSAKYQSTLLLLWFSSFYSFSFSNGSCQNFYCCHVTWWFFGFRIYSGFLAKAGTKWLF